MKHKPANLFNANTAISRILLIAICSFLYTGTSIKAQTVVTKQLYLSGPGQILDRIDPVAMASPTTLQTQNITPSPRYFYVLRGGSRTNFWRYDLSTNAWNSMAATPAVVSAGGSLTTDGTNVFALQGMSNAFWRYNVATNTWTSLANTPVNTGAGAALVFVNGSIYAFAGGNSNAFWRYNILTNTWAALANAPAIVNRGGSLTTDNTNVFAFRGNTTTDFWRYNILTNTWSVLTAAPGTIGAGGSLTFDGININALRGSNTNNSYRYTISTNSWSNLTNTPNPVNFGGAIISTDPTYYTLRGGNESDFWRNTGGTWVDMTDVPNNIDSGAAITKLGTLAIRTTFTQSPNLCSPLTIKGGNTISVSVYVGIAYGTMPVNPAITATLRYNVTGFPFTITTLTNPVYNGLTGMLTFTGSIASDLTIPAGVAIILDISSTQQGVAFYVEYDSQTKPSKINLPVTTYINVNNIELYNAPFPGGVPLSSATEGATLYVRTTVSDPFGFADITGADALINPIGTSFTGIPVSSSGCIKIFENEWNVPFTGITSHTVTATAREGYENTVTHTRVRTFVGCTICQPSANADTVTGNGGEPLDIDVLGNDTDPNFNIDPSSLTIVGYPQNGNAIVDNGKITYLPNGTFSGIDTLHYEICDWTSPAPLCDTAMVIITISSVDPNSCNQAGKSKIYYMPYAENEALLTLQRSSSVTLASTNIRTIISIKVSYPGMRFTWDHWEDGYEANISSPTQSTTEVWGDGNIFNGSAPGYPTDVLPVGASIVMDNIIATPRNPTIIFYDGKDKMFSSGQVSVTQVCGEPGTMAVQCMKTNVSAFPNDFGKLFTLPVGQNLPSRDFRYTSLFLRASENNTTVQIDRDNDGDFETNFTMSEGQVIMVDSTTAPAGIPVNAGAIITSDKPIGMDAHFAGIDNFSSREAPIYPATWYSSTYYTPVPTTGPATAPHDTAVVMLYNSLNRDIYINWSSGMPSSGVILLRANSSERFPLERSSNAAYKFENLSGESFVAMEIVDSYTPGGGGNEGSTRDWAFNLVAESRLTDFGSVAWAPGSTNFTRNDNPIWVTPAANTTVYVKNDGDVLNGALTSPCGLKYDVAVPLNMLQHIRIKDLADNDQSGTAVYTCDGVKIAMVYGEDPETALTASPSWDVGSTIQPFCKEKLIFAYNDYASTLINNPVTINVIKNDAGFLAIIDPASVTTTGLLQPKNGSLLINADGSIIYIPNTGFIGRDTFQYSVCSTPTPVICATAYVFITISSCPTPAGTNIIRGKVFLDKNADGINNDGGTGIAPGKIYLYIDGNCSGTVNPNELADSMNVDINGDYQFIKQPDKTISDDFDLTPGVSSCATGSDGNSPWRSNWYDNGDPSVGFCRTPALSAADTDVEIVPDGVSNQAIRLDDANRSAIREFDMQNASKVLISFSFRRGSASFAPGESVFLQLSSNGGPYNIIYQIGGTGVASATYTNISNITINAPAYNGNNRTFLRFVTSGNTDEGDNIYIDNVSIRLLQYNQCYLLSLNPASITPGNIITSPTVLPFTFFNSGTCSNSLDFGVKRMVTFSVNDENSTWQDINVSGVVKINDFDQENNTQTFGGFLNATTMAVLSSGATVQGINKAGGVVANAGSITFDADGNYVLDPASSFTGTITVPYKICDNGTPPACDTSYLSITVDSLPAVANAVIANNDENISYGTAVSKNLFINDRDVKKYPFTVTLFRYDSNGDGIPDITTAPGSVTVAGKSLTNTPVANAGTLSIAADGSYTFTPAPGFYGSIDALYQITNSFGAVSMAYLHIDVLNDINGIQNDPPFAGDDFGYITVNQPVSGSFINNDKDPNNNSVSLNGTTIVPSGPANPIGSPQATLRGGTVQFFSNGTYTYTPPLLYVGPDLIQYTICDITATAPQPLCANAIIHFLVAPGIDISGKVWDDGNGNVIPEMLFEVTTNVSNTLYVNLVNAAGIIIASEAVASDGTYSFLNVAPGEVYSLILSTIGGVPGTPAPPTTLPSGWINTGETRNGTIDLGNPGIIDNRLYGYTSVINHDFGIEQLPTSVPFYININDPVIGQVITMNGAANPAELGGFNPPVLSGNDPEDCSSGCTLDTRTIVIDVVPTNADLYYNGVLVTAGQLITNFNPNLLQLQITAATLGSNMTEFYYSFVDQAGRKDPVSAIYSLNWLTLLPAKGLALTTLKAGNNVVLDWKTITEINSDYFEIERSIDGRNYIKVGTIVKAAGNSNTEKQYQQRDDISNLKSPIVYYRVKLLDTKGKYAYSNVSAVKLPENGAVIKVVPNPFISELTVKILVEKPAQFGIRMLDMSGRTISNVIQRITKENPTVALKNLNSLVKGMYLMEVTEVESGKKNVFKVEKLN